MKRDQKEINKKISRSLKNTISKTGEKAHDDITLVCEKCKKVFVVSWKRRNAKTCSRKCNGWKNHDKIDWSKVHKKAYKEGKNFVAGSNTKWYDYRNLKVQGTYELRTCYILDKWKDINKIKCWEYTNDRIQYKDKNNRQRTYLLDFKVFDHDDSFYYIEVKGYKKENDIYKWKEVKKRKLDFVVWYLKDIIKQEKIVGIIV